jgi:hypothetical protein
VSRVYTRRQPDGGRGWAAISGADIDVPRALGPGWEPASRWEQVRWELTRGRFSWVDLVVISIIGALIRAWWFA